MFYLDKNERENSHTGNICFTKTRRQERTNRLVTYVLPRQEDKRELADWLHMFYQDKKTREN